MVNWLKLLKLSMIDMMGIKSIVISVPPLDNAWAVFGRNSKLIIGGAINNKGMENMLSSYNPAYISLAMLIFMTHEIGHSILGDSEALADVYMCQKAEGILGIDLSKGLTMGNIGMIDLLRKLKEKNRNVN
jgi:hypothetical protein